MVDIASTIVCPQWNIEVKGPVYGNADNPLSRFNLYNLNIDLRSVNYQWELFRIRNTVHSQISFSRLITDSGQFNAIKIESDLNRYPADDIGASALSSSGVSNLDKAFATGTNAGLMAYRDSFPPFSMGFSEVLFGNNANISGVDCRGRIGIYGPFQAITYIAAGQIRFDDTASGLLSLSFLTPSSSGVDAIVANKIATIEIEENYFLNPGSDFITVESGNIVIGENTYAVGYSGHGVRFSRQNAQVTTTVSPAALTGATGDLYFAGGVGTTAHPAADAIATDALGNSFAYISTP